MDKRYSNANVLFAQKYPIGTSVTRSQIDKFGFDLVTGANGHKADYVLGTAMSIEDEKRRVNRLRSDIERGGDTYKIVTVNASAGLYLVQSMTEYVIDAASPTTHIAKDASAVVAHQKARRALDELDEEDLSDSEKQKCDVRKTALDSLIEVGAKNVTLQSHAYQVTAIKALGYNDTDVPKLLPLFGEMEVLSRIQRRIGA